MSNDPIAQLFDRAKDAGIPMSHICVRANVAESTPSRWRGGWNTPSLKTLQRLNQALDEIINEGRPATEAAA